MFRGLFVCFLILKGFFLQENSEQESLADLESLGWMLPHVTVTAQITWVQEVSKEIIPAPQIT